MNRLAGETSPYLRQHRDNPVDWYPWGPEALTRAKELNRPLLSSAAFAGGIALPFTSLGRFPLKGVAEPQEVFVPSGEQPGSMSA